MAGHVIVFVTTVCGPPQLKNLRLYLKHTLFFINHITVDCFTMKANVINTVGEYREVTM